jgi:hypothetical protein
MTMKPGDICILLIVTKNNVKYALMMAVFWVVALCSVVQVYQRLRGACCLQRQGDNGGRKYL